MYFKAIVNNHNLQKNNNKSDFYFHNWLIINIFVVELMCSINYPLTFFSLIKYPFINV